MTVKITTINLLRFLKWIPGLLKNPLPTIIKITNKYGDLVQFNLTNSQKLILVNHPNYIKHILKDNQENYSRRKAIKPLEPFLGEGLFMSEGKLWEQMHQLVKPSFHDEQIKNYYSCIKTETTQFINSWKSKPIGSLVDVELEINILMLKILIKTQLSNSTEIDFIEIIKCLRILLSTASFANQKIDYAKTKLSKFIGVKFKEDKKTKQALNRLNEIILSIRNNAKEKPESIGFVLNILEQAKEKNIITDQQVRDEMMNFIFAGFDTTASALTWTLYCIAKHKNYQKSIQEEVKLQASSGLSLDEIAQTDSVKMIIQESMRLFPPVWSFHRVSINEDKLGDFIIPANSYLMICPYALHRHSELWEKPNEFYPEHFKQGNFQGKAFTYIPFGQGKRMCIGKPLAMAELQLIFTMFMSELNFELASNKEPIIVPGIIIKSKKPLLMKITSLTN